MPVQVALLRAINVGGHNRIVMSELRELFEQLGFAGVQTLLQSGNVVFRGDRLKGAGLERLLEAETEKRLDVAVDFVVRTAAEWAAVVQRNPFPKEAKNDPGQLLVLFLKKAPPATNVKALQAAIQGPEIVQARGKELYIVYPLGQGRSKLTTALVERELDTRGTGRGWNTVVKIAALAQA
jgi:uncharacterized protein (DUF1697 family)